MGLIRTKAKNWLVYLIELVLPDVEMQMELPGSHEESSAGSVFFVKKDIINKFPVGHGFSKK